ncbi:uncharacterized protein [Montipora foliosa]|uniref:uncharacterized protein n=1 Tax=Montipora foliosa TaxID=591990 RepID=UPI0035F14EAD
MIIWSFSPCPYSVLTIASEKKRNASHKNTGRVTENFLPLGLGGITETISRTDEVATCIQLLQQSCIDNDLSSEVTMPAFLNHSFEEICWQAYDSRRAVVVILLNPSNHHNQSRSAMLR